MKKLHLARAFRDEDYYLSLSEAERASLPDHPSEAVALDPRDLRAAAGGITTSVETCGTIACTPCKGHACG